MLSADFQALDAVSAQRSTLRKAQNTYRDQNGKHEEQCQRGSDDRSRESRTKEEQLELGGHLNGYPVLEHHLLTCL